jgi:erythromycin esterase
VLEYLVEEMGFTIFAIEANLPEADVVDDYVLNGNGTAAAALRGMYFWTWDTAEVLDMIEWMREYNLRRGDRPPVRFRGFDPQYAPWAVGTVERYVTRVDAAAAPTYASRLKCMLTARGEYRALSPQTRDACAASVAQALAAFTERRADYSARSSAVEYENHLRYLRVIQQSESILSGRRFRDDFMAENVEWLVDVAHPGEKAVLWAHNVHLAAHHVSLMGHPLKARFGEDIVNVAFAFDHGGFNAYGPDGFRAYTANDYPEGGWETFFREAGRPLFLLDMRNPQQSPQAAKYLAGTRRMWAIGAIWQPMYPNNQRWNVPLSEAYDVIIYIETVTPTVMNPF